jgi:CRP-like cAMP-binding protein
MTNLGDGSGQADPAERLARILADDEWTTGCLGHVLRRYAVERRPVARSLLFRQNDPADHVYLLETGSALLHRQLEPAYSSSPRSSIRWVADGDLLIVADADRRYATCHIVEASTVLIVERSRLLALAALDPKLDRLLTAVEDIEQDWRASGLVAERLPRPRLGLGTQPEPVGSGFR